MTYSELFFSKPSPDLERARQDRPHLHPRPVRGSHSESEEPTQTQSTGGILITVLAYELGLQARCLRGSNTGWHARNACPQLHAHGGAEAVGAFRTVSSNHAAFGCSPGVSGPC